MKNFTASETRKWFSGMFDYRIKTELFEDSEHLAEMLEMECNRQRKHEFMMKFADIGAAVWMQFDTPAEMQQYIDNVGLSKMYSLQLSDGSILRGLGTGDLVN